MTVAHAWRHARLLHKQHELKILELYSKIETLQRDLKEMSREHPYGFIYRGSENTEWTTEENYITPAGAIDGAMKKLRQGYAVILTPTTIDEMTRHAETQKVRRP